VDQDTCAAPVPPPDAPDRVYETTAEHVHIRLDVYRPAGTDTHPALILVHGGGWKSGCKTNVAPEAGRIVSAGFVVFAIDYRLDCDPNSPPPDVDDPALCGYTGIYPVTDVVTAVLWVRANAAHFGANPTRVAALGFSVGGNLVYAAGALGVPGSSAPDVVAGWSGSTELGYLRSGAVTCSESKTPAACTSVRTRHVGCDLTACPASWASLSAFADEKLTGPPAFVANSTHELVPFHEASDFAWKLRTLGVAHRLCTVDGDTHATGYEDMSCLGNSLSVFDRTMRFITNHLPAARGA
jgi:pectinesterase